MCVKPKPIWYFAYGSNMLSSKFTGGRGIVPISSARVRIPGWQITMEIPGLPYSEPSFSSISPKQIVDEEKSLRPDVLGVAYLITEDQYRQVVASEGGGIAYTDIRVTGEPIDEKSEAITGPRVILRSLGSALYRKPAPNPSKRYMDILREGAMENDLPLPYQEYLSEISYYKPRQSTWAKLGASIFLALWGPVMSAMESLTKASIREDGTATPIIVNVVRLTLWLIWASHDFIFAPIFGRGDGW